MSSDLFQQALSHHQTGDVAQAEVLYRQLLEINPNDISTLHAYGILLAQRHDYTAAKQLMALALSIDPHSPTLHTSMGNILMHLEKLSEAIQHYEKSIQLQPTSPVAYNNLGNLYAKQEDYPHAVSSYQKAIELKPDYTDAYYNLAIVQIKTEDNQNAIKNLNQALQLDPTFSEAHGQLGLLLQQANELANALQHYQARLKIEPNHPETYVNIGAILVKQGDLTSAINYFNKALQLKPHHTEAHYNLGSTYLSMGKLDQALQHYLQGINTTPDADACFNIGVIYSTKDRHQEAIDYFNWALTLRPDFFEAHANLATTYLKMENYTQAIEHYRQALQAQPENSEIKYILSALTEEHQKPTLAPKEFVANLFDQYAAHFEKHLLQYLKYQAHTLLFQAVTTELGDQLHDFSIIDLGCGTGLCGALFKPYAKQLVGIDISHNMIEQAQQKNVYDQLITGDMVEELSPFKDIDLIIAADVFGYMGDLTTVFKAVAISLKPTGYFAFTIEKLESGTFQLERSTRFTHSKHYIEQLSKEFNFTIIHEADVQLREQRQQAVMGCLYILQSCHE